MNRTAFRGVSIRAGVLPVMLPLLIVGCRITEDSPTEERIGMGLLYFGLVLAGTALLVGVALLGSLQWSK